MKRILFVDDEPKVLQGLQRMLRSMRHEWDMEFATNGQQALEMLTSASFDAIVTDMRMPGMDGAQLLTEVKKKYPKVVRIILSGQTDQEAFLSSACVVHQFLSKPCDTEALKATIMRSCALQDLLQDEALRRLVIQTGSLPCLSNLLAEVLELLKSPDASIEKIGQVIAKDMGMTAKILHLVNSAFYGLRRRISNPAEAVVVLGLNAIRALVLSHHMFTEVNKVKLPGFSPDTLWKHSFQAGVFAKKIAKSENAPAKDTDDALVTGMLHDLGRIVLISNMPEQYGKVLQSVREKNLSLCDAEREVFGGTHAEVGAYLIGLWGIADTVVEAIAYHHAPGKCSANTFSLVTAVHAADVLGSELYPGQAGTETLMDYPYIEKIGLSERLSVWRECCFNPEI